MADSTREKTVFGDSALGEALKRAVQEVLLGGDGVAGEGMEEVPQQRRQRGTPGDAGASEEATSADFLQEDVRRVAAQMMRKQFDLTCMETLRGESDDIDVPGFEETSEQPRLEGTAVSSKMLSNSWQIRVENAVFTLPNRDNMRLGTPDDVVRVDKLQIYAEDAVKTAIEQSGAKRNQELAEGRRRTLETLELEEASAKKASGGNVRKGHGTTSRKAVEPKKGAARPKKRQKKT